MKQKLKDGDEYDAMTRWRKYYHWRPGQIAKIKRRVNKRFRQEGKEAIRKEET